MGRFSWWQRVNIQYLMKPATIKRRFYVSTHWGRNKMAVIFQTTFSSGFSWMKMYEFRLTFHWSLFLGVRLAIFQHWYKPLSELMMVRLPTHICVTRPQWVKENRHHLRYSIKTTVDSNDKGPMTRKVCPCYDVIEMMHRLTVAMTH